MEDFELFKRILGQCIRRKRHSVGQTLESLAYDIQMDDKHLARIERGEKCPSSYTLALIQIALDINSDDYLKEFSKERQKLE